MSKKRTPSSDAPVAGAPDATPRRKRRWARRLGLTALILIVLMGTLYVFRQQLFGRWVADEVGASLSEVLGVPVRVERVLGTWITDARVEQIAVDTDEALGVLAGFDADSVVVRFSLWEVLFGDVIKGIHGVEADNLRLTLDFTRPSVTSGSDVALEDIVAAVPRTFPPINIDAEVTAITGAGIIEVADVAITSVDDVLRLDASQIVLPRPAGLAGELHARIQRNDSGLVWQCDSVVAGLTLREVTAGLDGSLVARGAAAGADFDIRVGKQDASVRTGTMQIAQIPPWVLRLLPASVFRPTSGTLTLQVDAHSLNPVHIEAQLDGAAIDFPDEHIRRLHARATIEPNRLTLTDTEIEARDGLLRAKDLVFDTQGALTVRSLEQVDLSIKNLQSWLDVDRALAIELHADSADASRVNIHDLSIEGPGTSLKGSARIDVPEDLDGFDKAPFEAQLKGVLGDNTFGPFKLDGSVSFDGRAFGTVTTPRIEGRVWGDDLLVDGHAIQHLDVEGSWLDGDLDLRRLNLRSDAASMKGSAKLQLEPLRIAASDLDFEIRDLKTVRTWIPNAELPQLSGVVGGQVRLRGTTDKLLGKVDLVASGLRIDEVHIANMQLQADARDDGVFTSAEARGPWGDLSASGVVHLGDKKAQIQALGGMLEGHEVLLGAPLSLDYDGGITFEGLDLRAFGGSVRGSASWKQEKLRAALAVEQIDLGALGRKPANGTASGSLTWTDEHQSARFSVQGWRFRGKTFAIEADASQSGAGLDVKRLVLDAGPALRLTGSGRLPIHISESGIVEQQIADAVFVVDASTDDLSAWIDAPLRGVRLHATGNNEQVDATIHGEQLEVIPGLAPVAQLVLDAVIKRGGTTVTGRIENDARLSGKLAATTDSGWTWTDGKVPALDRAVWDATLDATLHDAGAIVALLPESALDARGTMHGALTAKGPLDALELGGTATASGVQVRLRDVANFVDLTKLEAHLIEKKLRVTKIGIAYQLGSVADTPPPTSRPTVDPENELDIPEMAYIQDALATIKDMRGTLEGDVSILNVPHNPSLDGWLRGRDLFLEFPTLGTSARIPSLDIRLDGKRAVIQPARIEAGEGVAEFAGWLGIPIGSGDDRALADMPVEATVTATAPDIRALGRLIPALAGVAGSAKGRVTISHSIRNPTLSGELDAANVEMPVPGWKTPVRIPKIHAVADEQGVRISDAEVLWGRARATVNATLVPPERWTGDWAQQALDARIALDVPELSLLEEVSAELRRVNGRITGNVHATGTLFRPRLEGAIDLANIRGALPGALPSVDQLSGRIAFQDRSIQVTNMRGQLGHSPFTITGSAEIPEDGTPSVDLRLQGQNLRLVQTRDMRLRSDMDLRIAGPVGALEATGTVRIVDLVYVASMNLLGGGPETADTGLELFRFPWEPLASTKLDVRVQADDSIRIRTNVLRGNLSADVHFIGTGRAPIPRGRAFANNFLVKLPFSSLKIERGELRFAEDSPNSPTVDATARTEMKGYDLTVRVLGQVPDVELRTSSVPPLPENDAILLLTTGATNEELRREGLARAALTRIGSVFGQSLLSGGRGPSDPDERGFFDRFTFRQGRRVSRTGQETLEAEFEMSDRVYLRVEQDRYDDFNAGLVWRWRFR